MILVFGKTGQVASELRKLCPEAIFLDRQAANLEDPARAYEAIMDLRPNRVINAAAYTSVDNAASEKDLANSINGTAPGKMAQACSALQIPLVHISTEYVFDGFSALPYCPSDRTAPLGVYGSSKRSGEMAVLESNANAVVLRTSWVFSSSGINFVKKMMELSKTNSELSIVSDQWGGPTPASSLAQTCLEISDALIVNSEKRGVYHFSGKPDISRFGFAQEIFRILDRKIDVKAVKSSNYPTSARRPLNSRLNCTSLDKEFGVSRPDWRVRLLNVLDELGQRND